MSDTGIVDIVTLWLELFKVIHCGYYLPKGESLRYIPAHTIMVRLCHTSQWLLFCMLFLVVALCLGPTACVRKQNWQSGDEYHISHQCYIKSICLLQRALLNWTIMYPVQTPGYWSSVQTFIDIQSCEWVKETFVSSIDRYVTFHYRSSLIPSC